MPLDWGDTRRSLNTTQKDLKPVTSYRVVSLSEELKIVNGLFFLGKLQDLNESRIGEKKIKCIGQRDSNQYSFTHNLALICITMGCP